MPHAKSPRLETRRPLTPLRAARRKLPSTRVRARAQAAEARGWRVSAQVPQSRPGPLPRVRPEAARGNALWFARRSGTRTQGGVRPG